MKRTVQDSVTPRSHALIKRMIPPLTMWAVGKVLDTPPVKRGLKDLDQRFHRQKRAVARNAVRNRGWLTAGAAAVVVGLGLMAVATKR